MANERKKRPYLIEWKARITWNSKVIIQRNILDLFLRLPTTAICDQQPNPARHSSRSTALAPEQTHLTPMLGLTLLKHSLTNKMP